MVSAALSAFTDVEHKIFHILYSMIIFSMMENCVCELKITGAKNGWVLTSYDVVSVSTGTINTE